MRVEATLDLCAYPGELAREAHSYAALFHEATRRGLWPQRGDLVEGRYVKMYVEGGEQQIVALLATLHQAGHSCLVHTDTDDEAQLLRLQAGADPQTGYIQTWRR